MLPRARLGAAAARHVRLGGSAARWPTRRHGVAVNSQARRPFTPSPPAARPAGAWDDQPAPPRLPPDEQAEFERLVRAAQASAAAASLADAVAAANAEAAQKTEAEAEAAEKAAAAAAADEATAAPAPTTPPTTPPSALNGNPIEGVWRGAPPEFEGDRNPATGEIGGPKNEPLRWGGAGDWSYNGRVTDF